ncbi:hypothetical protein BDF20DRAFT_146957 [Mycotypha africana]|uniref:uncharacterized protein n=1 Tax=Mycotypha africana TaxID=64632 RepID=UPI00230106CA|nr:uncharacterized protein BDF20DRAFT_146957 [Mycotypha africana]KAI8969133.1 hypothetical protein BDF20DRAFT_146957 [Mycotypha africana]
MNIVSAELSADHVPTKISVTSQFPNNPFGLIVNGQRNQVLLDVTSKEDTPYTVFAISGQVFKADDFSQSVRNLTASRYEKLLQPGSTLQIPYNFYSEFAPGDHGLTVYVDLLNEKTVTRIVGYNGTITVTDPENSFFDPQLIVLYIVLIAGAVGVGYVIREAFFADTKKKTKKAKKVIESNEKPTHRDEKGEMVLDQSWIPEQHLNLSKGSPKAKKRATRK